MLISANMLYLLLINQSHIFTMCVIGVGNSLWLEEGGGGAIGWGAEY